MNNNTTTIIVPSGNNAELAPSTSRPSLSKRLKYLLSALAMLAIDQVYADYTVTYQYTEPVVTKEFDRWGGEFDYTFEKKTYTAPEIHYSPNIYGINKIEFSFSHSPRPDWVQTLQVDGVPYFTQTLYGEDVNSLFPRKSYSVQPHVTATFGENTTSAERVCIVTNTLAAKSYPASIGGQPTTSYFHWYCVIKQAPGSAIVTVTLDSNGGTDAVPNKTYNYVNGGETIYLGGGVTEPTINFYSGYMQPTTQRSWSPTNYLEENRRYAASFIMPTTTRAGCVFDGWWTVSTFPEANNVRISNADNSPIDGVKPTAKVTTIKAHWLFEAPHNFTATKNLTDMILLSWEPVAETSETTYNIYRSQSETCPATPTFMTSATSYNDTSAVAGQEYNYWIVAERPNYYSVSHSLTNTVSGYREMQQIATPTISPADGAIFFGTSEAVSLECATQGASIYYTTDGTTPDVNSSLYVSPFSISATTTIKAVAIKNGMKTSEIATATITRQLPLSLSDALDTDMTLSAYGSAEWIGVRDSAAKVGAGYAKNGVLGNRQSTSLSVIVSGKGAFSFWWRVSCEGYGEYDCDLATFSAPDSNVQELKRDGIMPEWEKITASFSTDGEHTLTWTYKKDKSDADGDDCLYLDGFSWTPAAPDPIVWTITFNLNGADAQDGTSPRSINDAAAIGELPTPTRAGYTFAGWWTEAEGGTEVTATTTVAADRTLFAHWTENLPPAPAYTETTPVPVRHDWLAKYSGILSAAGNDYEAAAMRPTGKKDGKGNALCVWHDYLAGTDPTNANSVFRAKVEFENGRPKVGWEPDLNEKGAKSERFYKVFGKKTLAANENWTRLADEAAQKDYNFFKVTVNMEETPDTEEELKFGDGSGTDGDSVIDDERPATLAAPANFNASSVYRGFGIYLSWNAVDGAEEYAVYRSDSANFSGAFKVASIVSPQNWYSDEDLEDFDTHYYWVRAETPTAVSSLSDCKSAAAATLGGPKNLTATEDRNDGVLLSWSAAIGATSYRVYYSNNIYAGQYVGSMTLLGETDGLEFLDTTIAAGEVRMYKILSLGERSDDWGSCSAVAGARASGSPQAPSVQISSSSYSVYLYWGPVAGATGYEVYRGTADNPSDAERIGVVESNGISTSYSYSDTPPVGKSYYWVKTIYPQGVGVFSDAVSAVFLSGPSNISASTLRNDGIMLSWDPVEGAGSYRIYDRNDNLIAESTDCFWLDTTVEAGELRTYKGSITSVCPDGESALDYGLSVQGYRPKVNEIVSVTLSGKSEITLKPDQETIIILFCSAAFSDGDSVPFRPLNAEDWDFGEYSEWIKGDGAMERLVDSAVSLHIDKDFPHGNTTRQVVARLKLTAPDGKVFNLSHAITVHPPE